MRNGAPIPEPKNNENIRVNLYLFPISKGKFSPGVPPWWFLTKLLQIFLANKVLLCNIFKYSNHKNLMERYDKEID